MEGRSVQPKSNRNHEKEEPVSMWEETGVGRRVRGVRGERELGARCVPGDPGPGSHAEDISTGRGAALPAGARPQSSHLLHTSASS